MKFYNTFKRIIGIKSPHLKLLMLIAGKSFAMRYAGIFIDPVMACNIRCRMCYFSDPEHVKGMKKGMLSDDEIEHMRKNLMPYAMKMQIGCGAEPTLYPRLSQLITVGKKAKIPYIEITTNGQLLDFKKIEELVKVGLDGMTLSLHGTTRETYENLMAGASFEKFKSLLDALKKIKQQYPKFILRVNYTANNLNKAELANLWDLFGELHIDVLQVRPIQKIGDSSYDDFEIANYHSFITDIIEPLAAECRRRATTPLLPSLDNIERVNKSVSRINALIEETTYCYVAPGSCYREDFNPKNETFHKYQSRTGLNKRLRKALFSRNLLNEDLTANITKKLNYQ